ncbi:MAG: lysozyme [Zetaproteobacteria bacterium]|nr:MAG: lysozyme [Zetaproteobacteria bacterium]
MQRLSALLIRHEGMRLKPYRDSVGKLTIGVGRNLDDVGLREEEARFLLENDLRAVIAELQPLPWFAALDPPRKHAIIDMGFNLGLPRLLGFRRMIAAIERGDWPAAADEMLDSRWARQVGRRAEELARTMRTGEEP